MKYIVEYQNFQPVNEELSWWQKLLAGASIFTSTFAPRDLPAQTKQDDKTKVYQRKTTSEKTAQNLQKTGWQLTKTETDTIWKEVQVAKPDTQLFTSTLHFDDAQFFASGKFTLTQEMKDSILNELNEINGTGGVVTDVMIESSTDKQQLTTNLKNNLQKLGYTGDNKGLSTARCNSILEFLVQQGMSDTIIEKNILFEQGEGEINQSSRYVIVRFAYIVVEENITPSETKMVPNVKKTFYLTKEVPTITKKRKIGDTKFRWGTKKIKKHGPIKNRKLNLKGVECRMPGGN